MSDGRRYRLTGAASGPFKCGRAASSGLPSRSPRCCWPAAPRRPMRSIRPIGGIRWRAGGSPRNGRRRPMPTRPTPAWAACQPSPRSSTPPPARGLPAGWWLTGPMPSMPARSDPIRPCPRPRRRLSKWVPRRRRSSPRVFRQSQRHLAGRERPTAAGPAAVAQWPATAAEAGPARQGRPRAAGRARGRAGGGRRHGALSPPPRRRRRGLPAWTCQRPRRRPHRRSPRRW